MYVQVLLVVSAPPTVLTRAWMSMPAPKTRAAVSGEMLTVRPEALRWSGSAPTGLSRFLDGLLQPVKTSARARATAP
jgi:hypothetical protein